MQKQLECGLCWNSSPDGPEMLFEHTECGHTFHKSCIGDLFFYEQRFWCRLCKKAVSSSQLKCISSLSTITSSPATRAPSSSLSLSCDETDYTFKVIILGDMGVGKTNLLKRFVMHEFTPSSESTVGFGIYNKKLRVGDKTVNLRLWDTGGQERFRSLCITANYLRDAAVILFAYAIDFPPSFHGLKSWMDYVEDKGAENVVKILVGTKADSQKDEDGRVELEEAENFANGRGMEIFQTSAKEPDFFSVNAVFNYAAAAAIDKLRFSGENPMRPDSIILTSSQSDGSNDHKERCRGGCS